MRKNYFQNVKIADKLKMVMKAIDLQYHML